MDSNSRQKRIFLLTDGEVCNTGEIIDYSRLSNKKARIHTFGIGDECDRNLIEKVAIAGRGSASFATDEQSNLSGQVIEALRRSFEPSLSDCTFDWP